MKHQRITKFIMAHPLRNINVTNSHNNPFSVCGDFSAKTKEVGQLTNRLALPPWSKDYDSAAMQDDQLGCTQFCCSVKTLIVDGCDRQTFGPITES